MDIKDARIDQKVRAPNGYEGRIVEIQATGRIRVDFGPNMAHYCPFTADKLVPVSKSCFAIGDKVKALRKSIYESDRSGETLTVIKPEYHCTDGRIVVEVNGGGLFMPDDLVKCDPCEDCQKFEAIRLKAFWEGKAEGEHAADRRLEVMEQNRDAWKATAQQNCRNAFYWREELEKLQKEAMKEYAIRQMSEIAKCYKQAEPEKLLMSQEARRVVEYLSSVEYAHIGGILEGMKNIMSGMAITDGLIEAREAGIVRLMDGKYSIARD